MMIHIPTASNCNAQIVDWQAMIGDNSIAIPSLNWKLQELAKELRDAYSKQAQHKSCNVSGSWAPVGHLVPFDHFEDSRVTKRSGSVSKPCIPGEHQIAGKWMFIPLKMVLIGIDPYPSDH